VGFDFKIKGYMFLDTWWFLLQHVCLPTTNILDFFGIAMQGAWLCWSYIYITVKLERHKTAAAQMWSFYTGGL